MADVSGTIVIPWYATLFRGDKFELALMEIAPVALRYGASDWEVTRFLDDPYKFQQLMHFPKGGFELYWYGPEFVEWRADYSSWYQVPVVYSPAKRVGQGHSGPEDVMVGQAGQHGSQEGDPAPIG